jgi:endonuclease/exonuclease/phosphatase family metal-dependent hydrolase
MKVMTYNVQHCLCEQTGQIDLCLFARLLLQSGADVIGVNEIYEDQARILAEKTDMNLHFAGAIHINGGFYGNAVLSRLPIVSAGTVPVPDPPEKRYSGYYETRCAANCIIAAGRTDVQFVITHFGLNPDEQQNAAETVLSLLRPERSVLMGDLNVTPENPVLIPLRDRLTDAASAFEEPLLSFPAHAPDRRIDYIFVSKDITVAAADIPAVVASDHRPHTAELIL